MHKRHALVGIHSIHSMHRHLACMSPPVVTAGEARKGVRGVGGGGGCRNLALLLFLSYSACRMRGPYLLAHREEEQRPEGRGKGSLGAGGFRAWHCHQSWHACIR